MRWFYDDNEAPSDLLYAIGGVPAEARAQAVFPARPLLLAEDSDDEPLRSSARLTRGGMRAVARIDATLFPVRFADKGSPFRHVEAIIEITGSAGKIAHEPMQPSPGPAAIAACVSRRPSATGSDPGLVVIDSEAVVDTVSVVSLTDSDDVAAPMPISMAQWAAATGGNLAKNLVAEIVATPSHYFFAYLNALASAPADTTRDDLTTPESVTTEASRYAISSVAPVLAKTAFATALTASKPWIVSGAALVAGAITYKRLSAALPDSPYRKTLLVIGPLVSSIVTGLSAGYDPFFTPISIAQSVTGKILEKFTAPDMTASLAAEKTSKTALIVDAVLEVALSAINNLLKSTANQSIGMIETHWAVKTALKRITTVVMGALKDATLNGARTGISHIGPGLYKKKDANEIEDSLGFLLSLAGWQAIGTDIADLTRHAGSYEAFGAVANHSAGAIGLEIDRPSGQIFFDYPILIHTIPALIDKIPGLYYTLDKEKKKKFNELEDDKSMGDAQWPGQRLFRPRGDSSASFYETIVTTL